MPWGILHVISNNPRKYTELTQSVLSHIIGHEDQERSCACLVRKLMNSRSFNCSNETKSWLNDNN